MVLIKIFTFVAMLRKSYIKKLFSTFVSALYLFVVLFSQDFHNHGNIPMFKNSDSGKFEKSYSKSDLKSDSSNCLSCHFLYTGNSLIPQEFDFEFSVSGDCKDENFSYESRLIVSQPQALFLRGPPERFV